MNKKSLLNILKILLIQIILVQTIISCSSDDDDNGKEDNGKNTEDTFVVPGFLITPAIQERDLMPEYLIGKYRYEFLNESDFEVKIMFLVGDERDSYELGSTTLEANSYPTIYSWHDDLPELTIAYTPANKVIHHIMDAGIFTGVFPPEVRFFNKD